MCAEAITNIFNQNDYSTYFPSLEITGAVDKLAFLLEKCDDPILQINIYNILVKLAEFRCPGTVDKVLQSIHFDQLANLLSRVAVEYHESLFAILMSLIKSGKRNAVERMFASGIEKNLITFLETETEVVQHHAFIISKAIYEMSGSPVNASLKPAHLSLLPWQMRLQLETFVFSDKSVPLNQNHKASNMSFIAY